MIQVLALGPPSDTKANPSSLEAPSLTGQQVGHLSLGGGRIDKNQLPSGTERSCMGLPSINKGTLAEGYEPSCKGTLAEGYEPSCRDDAGTPKTS